jgi:hypothetical protein
MPVARIWILGKYGGSEWSGLIWPRAGTGVGSCGHDNQPQGSTKYEEIFHLAECAITSSRTIETDRLLVKLVELINTYSYQQNTKARVHERSEMQWKRIVDCEGV